MGLLSTVEYHCQMEQLPSFSAISIQRCITHNLSDATFELQGFTDRSEKGYTVVYLQVASNSGTITTRLLMAKTKVVPLKVVTLPKLEVCAAVLLYICLHLLLNTLTPVLQLDCIYAWSDSSVALSWIKMSSHIRNTHLSQTG
ncbi:hypothetical protein PR048_021870 [Dryococelus australis]|uniref:Uncharacterized protein n=1 Tax=Dryococelus australis TaxID=614101 RepID=A0ABQ9GZP0_9NEOP|nr:hypothetical protein PR048_021870 [Dryococelus australis]